MMSDSVHPRFGRLLFRTRAATANLVFAFFFMGLLALVAAAGLFTSYEGVLRYGLSVPLAGFGAWLMTLGPRIARRGARVFEQGLVISAAGKKQPQEVAFSDVESFRYSSVETRVNGAHLMLQKGLVLSLRGAQFATVSQQVPKDDSSFDQARDLLASVIADRLVQEYDRRGEVPWVRGVHVARGELRIEGAFVGGVPQTRSVPLSAATRFVFSDGNCQVSLSDIDDPVLTVDCSEENFYPGLELIRRNLHREPPQLGAQAT